MAVFRFFAHSPSQPFVSLYFHEEHFLSGKQTSLEVAVDKVGNGNEKNRRLARLFLTFFLAEVGGGVSHINKQ